MCFSFLKFQLTINRWISKITCDIEMTLRLKHKYSSISKYEEQGNAKKIKLMPEFLDVHVGSVITKNGVENSQFLRYSRKILNLISKSKNIFFSGVQ